MKRIDIPTSTGPLTFRKPDDAAAMRLLRALLRAGLMPESQEAQQAVWNQLAPLCLSHHGRQLAARLDGDAPLLRQVIEAITSLPPGALGG